MAAAGDDPRHRLAVEARLAANSALFLGPRSADLRPACHTVTGDTLLRAEAQPWWGSSLKALPAPTACGGAAACGGGGRRGDGKGVGNDDDDEDGDGDEATTQADGGSPVSAAAPCTMRLPGRCMAAAAAATGGWR